MLRKFGLLLGLTALEGEEPQSRVRSEIDKETVRNADPEAKRNRNGENVPALAALPSGAG